MIRKFIEKCFVVFFFFCSFISGNIAYSDTVDQENGQWSRGRVVMYNTPEAQLMIRVGDIDNFGFPMVDRDGNELDPFSGERTKVHGFPFKPEGDDPDGTDRIMVVTGYDYGNWRLARDGYAGSTRRTDGSNYLSNSVRGIHFDFREHIDNISVENVYMQMFLDDFQAQKEGVHQGFRGNNRYSCYFTSHVNGTEVNEFLPELDQIINNLNQHGPVGNMITFQVPERAMHLFEHGSLTLNIDDKRSGATGDGFAIDFVKILVNKSDFRYSSKVRGMVTDENGNPLEGVLVSAGGSEDNTDEDGSYEIEDVPAGQVIVTASKTGYRGENSVLESVQPGNSFKVDFQLREAPKPAIPIFNASPTTATKIGVDLEIIYPIEPSEPVIKEYKVDEGQWKSYVEVVHFDRNVTVQARSTDAFGNTSEIGSISIDNILRPTVKIIVSDAEGTKAPYITIGEEQKIDGIKDEFVGLKGQGYAKVSGEGLGGRTFKYQFIRSIGVPEEIYPDLWKTYEIDENNSEDVVLDKEGFLNQRSYNVNHLATMGDHSKWENREEVYKNPFESTHQKSSGRSTSPAQYGEIENHPEQGGIIPRWVNNTVFMSNMYIGNNYKEASKFWGYIKVPTTGRYVFGAVSDDGCKGVITIGEDSTTFVNMFKVQGSTFGSKRREVNLEQGVYYPVYIEYFNWGGGAHFELLYKLNPTGSLSSLNKNNMTRIPKNWFYPSKNLAAGEFAEGVFKGSSGIKFPERSGDYYFAYEVEGEDSVLREGVLGPYTVNGNSDIFTSRELVKGNIEEQGIEFQMKYTINIDRVPLRSSFKINEEYPQELRIEEVLIEDAIPQGVEVVSQDESITINGQKIKIVLDDITLMLMGEGDSRYYWNEGVSKEISLVGNEKGTYTFEEDESAISFEDVNGSKRQLKFPSRDIEIIEPSEIITDILRGSEVDATAGEEFEILYEFRGEESYISDDSEAIQFQSIVYDESFPPMIDIIQVPAGLDVTGSLEEGYRVHGAVEGVSMERIPNVDNRYRVQGQLAIVIKAKYPGVYELNKGSLAYILNSSREGAAFSNNMVLNVKGERLETLKVLELSPDQFELEESDFSSFVKVGGSVELHKMSIRMFNGSVEEINGNYDIVYIGNGSGGYKGIGDKSQALPQGNTHSGDYSEYYSGVDVTKRRFKSLEEFITSGQLLIVDGDMPQSDMVYIYQKIDEYSSKSNVVTVNNSSDILSIGNDRYDEFVRRPQMGLSILPAEYDGTASSYNEVSTMTFVFDLHNRNVRNKRENMMSLELLIDKNGDGIFSGEEIVYEGEQNYNGQGYSLAYNIEDITTGVVPWELRATDVESGARDIEKGFSAFRGRKSVVRVLHLIPDGGSSLQLTNENNLFKAPLITDDYEIRVTELPVSIFDNSFPNEVQYNGEKIKTSLNGNYDMIILGFKDVFGGSDIGREDTVEGLKKFISTSQSVMFTHDTFMYNTKNANSPCYNITKEFRDISGQSVYKDENNPDELDLIGNEIPHMQYPEEGKKSFGFSHGALKRAEGEGYDFVTSAVKVNESIITRYPYIINDVIPISQTHYQYFQLNLEDPEVVPLFNMDFGDWRNTDSRNYFYTYSKGNITYSGTGHSSPNGIDEHKLFVNTILKASRNANRAPELEVINLNENKVFAKGDNDLQFAFIPFDLDGDKLEGEMSINGVSVKKYAFEEITNGNSVEVRIDKDIIKELVGDENRFTVKITLCDSRGAKVEEERNIRYSTMPVISIETRDVVECLVGDSATFNVSLRGERGGAEYDINIENLQYTMVYDDEEIDVLGSDSWDNLSDIIFTPQPQPDVQSKLFSFKVLREGNLVVNNRITHSYSEDVGQEGVAEKEVLISSKTGGINISTVNGDEVSFGNLGIKVTDPAGEIQNFTTDDNGLLFVGNVVTGRYSIQVTGLDDKYYVIDGKERFLHMSYERNMENLEFKIIDTTKIGLHMESSVEEKMLIGDKNILKLKAMAFNENTAVDTVIHDVKTEIQWSDQGMIPDDNGIWYLENIHVHGSSVSNKEQKKNIALTADEAGIYNIRGNLKYKYFGDISKVVNFEKRISVRSGVIKTTVLNSSGGICDDIEVIIKSKDTGEVVRSGRTDSTGTFTAVGISSGEYEVTVEDLSDFISGEEYRKDVELSYDNYHAEIVFQSERDSVIIKTGLLVDGDFVDGKKIAPGFIANIGIDFKVLNKNAFMDLDLNQGTQKVQFKLYRFDQWGNQKRVREDIKIELGSVESEEHWNSISFEESDDRDITLKLPPSDNLFNHYLLICKIRHSSEVDSINSLIMNLNGESDGSQEFIVVERPKLD